MDSSKPTPYSRLMPPLHALAGADVEPGEQEEQQAEADVHEILHLLTSEGRHGTRQKQERIALPQGAAICAELVCREDERTGAVVARFQLQDQPLDGAVFESRDPAHFGRVHEVDVVSGSIGAVDDRIHEGTHVQPRRLRRGGGCRDCTS